MPSLTSQHQLMLATHAPHGNDMFRWNSPSSFPCNFPYRFLLCAFASLRLRVKNPTVSRYGDDMSSILCSAGPNLFPKRLPANNMTQTKPPIATTSTINPQKWCVSNRFSDGA